LRIANVMHREPPFVSPLLDVMEKQRAYSRHTAQLVEIATHKGIVDISHPPPCPRLVEHEKHRASYRASRTRAEDDNTRAIGEIRRISVRKGNPPPAHPPHLPVPTFNWAAKLRKCEQQISVAPRLPFAEPTRGGTAAQRHRIIQEGGMTVVNGDKSARPRIKPITPERTTPRKVNPSGKKSLRRPAAMSDLAAKPPEVETSTTPEEPKEAHVEVEPQPQQQQEVKKRRRKKRRQVGPTLVNADAQTDEPRSMEQEPAKDDGIPANKEEAQNEVVTLIGQEEEEAQNEIVTLAVCEEKEGVSLPIVDEVFNSGGDEQPIAETANPLDDGADEMLGRQVNEVNSRQGDGETCDRQMDDVHDLQADEGGDATVKPPMEGRNAPEVAALGDFLAETLSSDDDPVLEDMTPQTEEEDEDGAYELIGSTHRPRGRQSQMPEDAAVTEGPIHFDQGRSEPEVTFLRDFLNEILMLSDDETEPTNERQPEDEAQLFDKVHAEGEALPEGEGPPNIMQSVGPWLPEEENTDEIPQDGMQPQADVRHNEEEAKTEVIGSQSQAPQELAQSSDLLVLNMSFSQRVPLVGQGDRSQQSVSEKDPSQVLLVAPIPEGDEAQPPATHDGNHEEETTTTSAETGEGTAPAVTDVGEEDESVPVLSCADDRDKTAQAGDNEPREARNCADVGEEREAESAVPEGDEKEKQEPGAYIDEEEEEEPAVPSGDGQEEAETVAAAVDGDKEAEAAAGLEVSVVPDDVGEMLTLPDTLGASAPEAEPGQETVSDGEMRPSDLIEDTLQPAVGDNSDHAETDAVAPDVLSPILSREPSVEQQTECTRVEPEAANIGGGDEAPVVPLTDSLSEAPGATGDFTSVPFAAGQQDQPAVADAKEVVGDENEMQPEAGVTPLPDIINGVFTAEPAPVEEAKGETPDESEHSAVTQDQGEAVMTAESGFAGNEAAKESELETHSDGLSGPLAPIRDAQPTPEEEMKGEKPKMIPYEPEYPADDNLEPNTTTEEADGENEPLPDVTRALISTHDEEPSPEEERKQEDLPTMPDEPDHLAVADHEAEPQEIAEFAAASQKELAGKSELEPLPDILDASLCPSTNTEPAPEEPDHLAIPQDQIKSKEIARSTTAQNFVAEESRLESLSDLIGETLMPSANREPAPTEEAKGEQLATISHGPDRSAVIQDESESKTVTDPAVSENESLFGGLATPDREPAPEELGARSGLTEDSTGPQDEAQYRTFGDDKAAFQPKGPSGSELEPLPDALDWNGIVAQNEVEPKPNCESAGLLAAANTQQPEVAPESELEPVPEANGGSLRQRVGAKPVPEECTMASERTTMPDVLEEFAAAQRGLESALDHELLSDVMDGSLAPSGNAKEDAAATITDSAETGTPSAVQRESDPEPIPDVIDGNFMPVTICDHTEREIESEPAKELDAEPLSDLSVWAAGAEHRAEEPIVMSGHSAVTQNELLSDVIAHSAAPQVGDIGPAKPGFTVPDILMENLAPGGQSPEEHDAIEPQMIAGDDSELDAQIPDVSQETSPKSASNEGAGVVRTVGAAPPAEDVGNQSPGGEMTAISEDSQQPASLEGTVETLGDSLVADAPEADGTPDGDEQTNAGDTFMSDETMPRPD
jgi:hypothetical protein